MPLLHRLLTRPSTFSVWRRHPGYVGAYAVDLFLLFGLGLTALYGNPLRFSAASYTSVRYTGVAVWGAILTVGGVLLLLGALGTARATMTVLAVVAVAYLTLGIYFWVAAGNIDTVSWWGAWVFIALGLWHLSQANEYRRARPAPLDDALWVLEDPPESPSDAP